jgi:uncharacterized lipoprotein YmbA
MRNNLKTVHFFALFVIFLGHGCIIPESNHVAPDFYLLSDLALPAEQTPHDTELTFYLREIELPRYLKEPRMVIRPSEHTIQFRESERWGEPLEDGISRAVSLNIQNQVSKSQFSIFPNRRKEGLDWDLSISFSSFELIGQEVVVVAKWEAKKKGAELITGSFAQKTEINQSDSVDQEISALNHSLFELSSELIKTLLVK